MAIFQSTSVSAVILVICLACRVAGAEAVTVDGRVLEGAFSGAGAEVVFASGSDHIDLARIARVTLQKDLTDVPLVSGIRFKDDTLVRGRVTLGRESVKVHSARLGEIEVPVRNTADIFIECRGEMPDDTPTGALLVNGDFLSAGSISISPDGAVMDSALGHIELPPGRIAAVRLRRREPCLAGAVVVLDNGDRLNAATLAAVPGGFNVSCIFGEVEVPAKWISEISFPERMRYLSDTPATVTLHGFAPEGVRYCWADRGPGTCLESRLVRFRRGFFVRAGAAASVPLPRGAETLVFVPQIAAGSNPAAGKFSVRTGEGEIWTKRIDSDSLPEAVVLKLGGAASVTLSFDSKPSGLFGAAGIWGDSFVTIGPQK
ncbi:MAG: hypothetical protein J7M19_09980 [Planctomycetes bacterium]|nr:hypothetical protein [Planctomycetota bacterium]